MAKDIIKLQVQILGPVTWLGAAVAALAALNVSAQTTNCVPPASGLISWWPGDGNANDFLGRANGTYSGGYTTGIVGQAFTSVSVAISNSPSLNPTNGITIEAWVLTSGGGGGNSFYVVSKDGDTANRQYILSIGPYGRFRAHIGVPALVYFDGQTVVQPNTWYHVAMTYDRVALNLYVNGNLDGTIGATGPILVTPEPVRLGGGSPYTPYYSGIIDEASLYDRALSASEIQAIYSANGAGKCKIPFPASIVSEPNSRTQNAGTDALFSVGAIGTPPLTYQWEINSTNVAGATGSNLTLTNVQSRDAGVYRVVVTNSVATVTSAPANLVVSPTAPVVQAGPPNRNAIAGTQLSLFVSAYGSEPLNYQWRLNATNLPGATGASLVFDAVQTTDAGKYDADISNSFGSVTSRVATLTVRDYPKPSTIVAWGDNSYGQTTPPAGETNVVAIAAGALQTVLLRQDGTLGDFGSQIASPITYSDLPGAAAVGTVDFYGLALGTDGRPTAFGLTYLSGASDVPTSVTNAVAIAIGTPRLALKDDGIVVGWLPGLYNGPPDPSGIFASLTTLSDVADIAMRGSHCLALRSNHTVVAFGSNNNGETNVPPGLNDVAAISAGAAHCLALKTDGTVVAWGNNGSGQTNVPEGLSGVIAISAGDLHNLALKSNGVVVAWGDNSYGQTNVPSNLSNVVFISAGSHHSAVLTKQPGIAIAPLTQTAFAGTDVTFTSFATGYAPLFYHWMHDGTDIAWATNFSLSLVNVPLTGAGNYQCVVSNAFGTATSFPASLTVLRQRPLFDASWSRTHSTNRNFGLLLNYLSGHGNIILEASTNLLDWEAIYTNPPVLGSFQYFDSAATIMPSRFYRAIEQ